MTNFNSRDDRHILFVSSSLDGGGAERALSVLANEFYRMGYNVEFIVLHSKIVKYKLEAGIHLKFIEYTGGNRICKMISKLCLLRKEMKKSKSDTVIAFMYETNLYALLAAVGLKKKVLVSERNDPYQEPNSKIIRLVRDLSYQLADWLVCQTNDAKAYFNKRLQKKSSVILNPLNLTINPYIGQRAKHIVTWCRLSEQKNIPLLLNAFHDFVQIHNDYDLNIYGEGHLLNTLVEMCGILGIGDKVSFKGFSNDIHNLVKDAAMFVLPSNYEGLSNSMLEAMALGIPTICTDCPIGGAKMMIEDGYNGMLVPLNDKEALVKSMRRIAEDSEFANTLSKNAVKIRAKLDVGIIAKQWEDLANKLKV